MAMLVCALLVIPEIIVKHLLIIVYHHHVRMEDHVFQLSMVIDAFANKASLVQIATF
ncbi:hypothetical protein BpHYR1_049240 [Brachionus plicatilis]|uniref:Uncharacterized protein n=1 Tax=Brachionus plicatilis TaxID=10195 RepID=A0A3M7QP70_BRAPC|nr:hypothetical protein BpHYR1_049240 [Brachionus plicatilis]